MNADHQLAEAWRIIRLSMQFRDHGYWIVWENNVKALLLNSFTKTKYSNLFNTLGVCGS